MDVERLIAAIGLFVLAPASLIFMVYMAVYGG